MSVASRSRTGSPADPDDDAENARGFVSVATAVKLLETKFDGNPKDLQEFIDNVENAYSIISPADHPTFLKFVLAKITGDAKLTLNFKEMPAEAAAWENVKEKLEMHYAVHRTLDYYANKLFTSKQTHSENVTQWGSRVEKMTSDLIRSSSKVMNNWNYDKKMGGRDIIVHLSRACFVQGLVDEQIKTIVRVKCDQMSMKQLIELAVEEESARRSYEKSKWYQTDKKAMASKSNSSHQFQGARMGVKSRPENVKRGPSGVHAVAPIMCFRCGKQGHVAKQCRGDAFCKACRKVGHETRECPVQGNRQ